LFSLFNFPETILIIGESHVPVAIKTFGFLVSFNTNPQYIHFIFIREPNLITFNSLPPLQVSFTFIKNLRILFLYQITE
jgi:hypothetical protein